jgi:hypothetical protein
MALAFQVGGGEPASRYNATSNTANGRSKMILKQGDTAPDFTFRRGEDSAEVTLSSLWRERPLVVAFLRHFG